MDDNPEQRLKRKKTKHCEKTDSDLKEEYESRLLKKMLTETTDDSVNSGEQSPLVDDANKQLMDSELDMESIQQQAQLVVPQNYNAQTTLAAFVDRSTIQSDANKKQVVSVTINQQIELSDNNKSQNEAKLTVNPTVQALFNGTLPDDFYLHLISVMGIQKCLLSNRLVCSFWNELVLERCNNQKSLKLFENFDSLMKYGKWLLKFEKMEDTSLILKPIGDDLLFEGLEIDHEQLVNSLYQKDDDDDDEDDDVEEKGEEDDGEDVQIKVLTWEKKLAASKVLTTIFPKIEQLVLSTEYDTCINIEHILQFYDEQLTSFTMANYDNWANPGHILRDFSFLKLKSLNTFNFSPEADQLLSLLPQLVSLTIKNTTISLETLLRNGTQLRELNIDEIKSVNTAPVAEFSKRPPIHANLRKFSFDSTENELQTLEFISLNLTSLECLKLDFELARYNFRPNPDNVSHLHSVTSHLVPLYQLHSLTLQAPFSFFLLDDNQLADIEPLPSVRQLKLLLSKCAPLSMDLFSRALFTAFPNAEQVQIGFLGNKPYYKEDNPDMCFTFKRNNGDGRVDSEAFAAFVDFASKHPNVVQLFRSKDISKLTHLPNAVSPLLGQHRQVYAEYIEEVELFGVAICQMAASLVLQKGQEPPNLKSALRYPDRLTAMSNLLQLLESDTFTFTCEKVRAMMRQMVECALEYDLSQVSLFIVTCKCVLFLLDCDVIYLGDKTSFLNTYQFYAYSHFEMLLNLVEHYKSQQFNDKELLFQLYRHMPPMNFDVIEDARYDEFQMFKSFLELAGYYKTEQLSDLDNDEELLLYIYEKIDDIMYLFEWDAQLDIVLKVIRELIRSENSVYRVEIDSAMTRFTNSANNYYFKLLRGEIEIDSSDKDLSDNDSSDGSSAESES